MPYNELRRTVGGRRQGAGRKPIYPDGSRVIQLKLAPAVLSRLRRGRGAKSLRKHAGDVLTAAVLQQGE